MDTNESPQTLLAAATSLLHEGQPAPALIKARKALAKLQPNPLNPTLAALPALNLLGEISIELGDAQEARDCFEVAAALDPDGLIPESSGGGAEKFMWLAQLSEEGGQESVSWYEKGAEVLRRDIAALDANSKNAAVQQTIKEKVARLAAVLCSTAEVYMTDLSWEEDAEQRCEALVSEALLVAPDDPSTLQTLANVRLSQDKQEEARQYLTQSLNLWKDLEPEDPGVPDFPTRVSLSRLLMEAGMEEEALEVLERLVSEDDSSVEAWYLGGWCLKLLAEKGRAELNGITNGMDVDGSDDTHGDRRLLKLCRDYLTKSLALYQLHEYEDERLKEHVEELMRELNGILGEPVEDDEDDEDEWEGIEDSDEDEQMEGT